jgi:hypothetical protein
MVNRLAAEVQLGRLRVGERAGVPYPRGVSDPEPRAATVGRTRARVLDLRLVSAVALLTACGDDHLPISYETEHLRIGTHPDITLCAGDLIAFEEVFQRVEDDFGLSPDSKISVSIWSDEAWATVAASYCSGPSVLGCFYPHNASIFTSWFAVGHELAHAAIAVPGIPPFFDEALADVYGGRQTRFGVTAPSDSLELSADDMNRATARHFVMWLRATYGVAKLGELVRSGKAANRRFAEIYGLSFAEAEAKYFAEAPYGYPRLDTCNAAPLGFDGDFGGWRTDIEVDCATGKDIHYHGVGPVVRRSFDIPLAGHYTISTDVDLIMLSRCATGPIDEPHRFEDFFHDDVPPSYAGEISEHFRVYEGGTLVDLYFEEGKHEIGLLLIGFDASEASLAIWPTIGPVPIEVEG